MSEGWKAARPGHFRDVCFTAVLFTGKETRYGESTVRQQSGKAVEIYLQAEG